MTTNTLKAPLKVKEFIAAPGDFRHGLGKACLKFRFACRRARQRPPSTLQPER
jgi:hypothetical protein